MAKPTTIPVNCTSYRLAIDSVTATSSVGTDYFSVATYGQATIYLKVTGTAGTSPTLDVKLQKQLPDGATWQDIAAFTQFTGNANRVMHLTNGGNLEEAQAAGSLTAGTINGVPFGTIWRLYYVIAGTSPSFTIAAYIEVTK